MSGRFASVGVDALPADPAGKYAYHGTEIKHLASIAQQGLLPDNLSKAEYIAKWGGTTGSGREAMYLTPSPQLAAPYTVSSALLRVPRAQLPEAKVSQGGRIIRTKETVAPQHVEVWHDGQWKSVTGVFESQSIS